MAREVHTAKLARDPRANRLQRPSWMDWAELIVAAADSDMYQHAARSLKDGEDNACKDS